MVRGLRALVACTMITAIFLGPAPVAANDLSPCEGGAFDSATAEIIDVDSLIVPEDGVLTFAGGTTIKAQTLVVQGVLTSADGTDEGAAGGDLCIVAGSIIVGEAGVLCTGHGAAGSDRSVALGGGTVSGASGARGGDLNIILDGSDDGLTIKPGGVLCTGEGGDAGSLLVVHSSFNPESFSCQRDAGAAAAWALGGYGGNAGHLSIAGDAGTDPFQLAPGSILLGRGGHGGSVLHMGNPGGGYHGVGGSGGASMLAFNGSPVLPQEIRAALGTATGGDGGAGWALPCAESGMAEAPLTEVQEGASGLCNELGLGECEVSVPLGNTGTWCGGFSQGIPEPAAKSVENLCNIVYDSLGCPPGASPAACGYDCQDPEFSTCLVETCDEAGGGQACEEAAECSSVTLETCIEQTCEENGIPGCEITTPTPPCQGFITVECMVDGVVDWCQEMGLGPACAAIEPDSCEFGVVYCTLSTLAEVCYFGGIGPCNLIDDLAEGYLGYPVWGPDGEDIAVAPGNGGQGDPGSGGQNGDAYSQAYSTGVYGGPGGAGVSASIHCEGGRDATTPLITTEMEGGNGGAVSTGGGWGGPGFLLGGRGGQAHATGADGGDGGAGGSGGNADAGFCWHGTYWSADERPGANGGKGGPGGLSSGGTVTGGQGGGSWVQPGKGGDASATGGKGGNGGMGGNGGSPDAEFNWWCGGGVSPSGELVPDPNDLPGWIEKWLTLPPGGADPLDCPLFAKAGPGQIGCGGVAGDFGTIAILGGAGGRSFVTGDYTGPPGSPGQSTGIPGEPGAPGADGVVGLPRICIAEDDLGPALPLEP